MANEIMSLHGWGDCVFLHNCPFYSILVIEEKQPVPKVIRVVRSFYDLSKSAKEWTLSDFTEA